MSSATKPCSSPPLDSWPLTTHASAPSQEEMLSCLDLFVHNARQGAPLPSLSSAAQRTATQAIRNHCRHLSDSSQLVATIDARDCITVV